MMNKNSHNFHRQAVTGGEGWLVGGKGGVVIVQGGEVGVACVHTPLPSGKMSVVVNVMIFRFPAMY